MAQHNNLTEGSVLKSLAAISIPIIFSNILQTAYQLTDTFWVGRLGANAVAAVSLSFPVIFLLVSLGGGFAMSGTILVAQYKGAANHRKTNHVAGQTLLVGVVMSALVALVGYVISPQLIKLMGAEQAVYINAVMYLKMTFLGMIFMFTYMVFESLMRGVGDPKTPLYIVIFTVLLNLLLDPLFIMGYGPIPAFGVAGAALATIGTQGLASIIGIIILLRGKHSVQLKTMHLKPDYSIIRRMFSLGFPSSIDQSMRALGITLMVFLVTSFGTNTLAAYGIGSRVFSFVIIPGIGLSIATATLVGQNIGAKKTERAEEIIKIASKLGFAVLTLVGIIIFIFARQLSAAFIPGEEIAIASSTQFIRIMSLTYGFVGVQMAVGGGFRGAGNTFLSMMLTIVSLWVLQFPVAYVLSKHTLLAERGIWYAYPISNVLTSIIMVIWFMRGTWKNVNVTEEEIIEEKVAEEIMMDEGLQ